MLVSMSGWHRQALEFLLSLARTSDIPAARDPLAADAGIQRAGRPPQISFTRSGIGMTGKLASGKGQQL
jgi:hypothetical protein